MCKLSDRYIFAEICRIQPLKQQLCKRFGNGKKLTE